MQHFKANTAVNVQSRVMGLAVVLALILHFFLFLLLDGFFKPKAYLADQTSYKVALVSRAEQAPLKPNSEVVEENLLDKHSQHEEPRAEAEDKPAVEPVKQTVAENSKPASQRKQTPATLPTELTKAQPDKPNAATRQVTSTEFKQTRVNQLESDTPKPKKPEPKVAETKPAEQELAATGKQTSEPVKNTEKQIVKDVPQQQTQKPASAPDEPQGKLREPQFLIGSPDNPKPVYPQRALNRGWEGDVVLGVHIDANGLVTYVEILETSNVSVLDFAAYSTVKDNWRFSPADEDERDLRGFVTVPISFRIN